MKKDEIISILMAFQQADFYKLDGLPSAIRLTDLTSIFNIEDDWRGEKKLGTEQKATAYAYITVPAFEEQVRVWLNGDNVFMMDIHDPLPGPVNSKYLNVLESPDAKLDAYLGPLLITDSEWVYSARGLTLYINPENLICLRMVIFIPSNLEYYIKNLRLDLKTNRQPF